MFPFLQRATFQGVLATDFSKTFAVFIYPCRGPHSDILPYATIGYVTRDGLYDNYKGNFSCFKQSLTKVVFEITGILHVPNTIVTHYYLCSAGDAP